MARACLLGFVLVLSALLVIIVVETYNGNKLVRNRRGWNLPPLKLYENFAMARFPVGYIAEILAHVDIAADVIYSLEGIIANQFPVHVFVVDQHKTGLIRVTKALDRKETAAYNLSGIAAYTDRPETEIDARIQMVDGNDNHDAFGNPGNTEPSPAGISLMKITATDEPGTENSQVVYTVVEQKPAGGVFTLTQDGSLYVDETSLDLEKAEKYIVVVKGQEVTGKPEENAATGTVIINIQHVNANLPTLGREQVASYFRSGKVFCAVTRAA